MNKNRQNTLSVSERKEKIRKRYKGRNLDNIVVIPANTPAGLFDDSEHKRVAVYARVSTDDPNQTSSYELQKNYYEDLVSKHPNWILVDIYADEGISGTSLNHRDEFVRMMDDCRKGLIDLVLTKSVSRFARNVEDCIHYSRELKALKPPVGILFETENIYTLDSNSEMQLAFLATLAQEESHIKSEGMNRSIEMRFERGIFLTPVLLGYDHDEEGNLVPNESESKTVKLIFYMCLAGFSLDDIAKKLMELNRKTKINNTEWSTSSINGILRNERYCGAVLAHKTYTPDFLTHKSVKNRGERAQYYEENHHQAIISKEVYVAAQKMLDQIKYRFKKATPSLKVIDKGVLKGFVQINPCWMGFKPEDYIRASHSVLNDGDYLEPEVVIQKSKGDYDLRDYQVARSQFVPTTRKISVTFGRETIKFSYDAIKEFNEEMYVELLYHPLLQLLVVRKSTRGDSHSIKWSTYAKERIVPRKNTNPAFVPILYELCDWNLDYGYTITGYVKEKDNEKIMLFYMNEPEIRKWVDGKQIISYPSEWKDEFGDYYNIHLAKTISVFAKDNEWKLRQPGVVAVEPDFYMLPDEELLKMIDKIVDDIKAEREDIHNEFE